MFYVYHVTNLNENVFSIAQLTQIDKIVNLFPDWFYVRDLKKGKLIVGDGLLDLTKNLYKFHDLTRPKSKLTTLISHTNDRI
jgi:hypothetical protein